MLLEAKIAASERATPLATIAPCHTERATLRLSRLTGFGVPHTTNGKAAALSSAAYLRDHFTTCADLCRREAEAMSLR